MRLRRLLKKPSKKNLKRLLETSLREHLPLRSHLPPQKSRPKPKMRMTARANPRKTKKTAIMPMRRSLLSWIRSISKRNVRYSKRRRCVRRNGFNR
jgi:hypothetical protein